ncbi:Periplasmic serine endoprotease DegP [Candidatus Entotheonellaceae bacterium PAL068K]
MPRRVLVSHRSRRLPIVLMAGLWLFCLIHHAALGATPFWQEGQRTPPVQQPRPPAFVELAKELKPAVVNIRSKQAVERRRQRFPFGEEEDPFQEFFDRFFGRRSPRRQRPSLGSGFIIHSTGYIVTNNHVVKDATEIKVTLATQEEFDATLIGRDPKTDVALIKIDSEASLPTVPFGDSAGLEVGDWVLAIGNPFGLGHTVTAGIVSAKGRIIGAGPYDRFIQTDASINPGNSGGPLFNMHGEVIGINTAIFAAGQGIGFAIPSNMAKEILLQLHDQGKVTRGWLGVAIQSLSPDLGKAFGLEMIQGALVADVMPDSPAAAAGLKRGDIIVSFHGQKVQNSRELPHMVAAMPPDTEVNVEIIRGGSRRTIAVTLGILPESDEKQQKAKRLEPSEVEEALGLQVQSITADIAQALRLDDTGGVVVVQLDPSGPAAEVGIRRGDVVREVNRTPVTDIESYEDATAHLDPDMPVLFLLERRGSGLYIALKPRKTG